MYEKTTKSLRYKFHNCDIEVENKTFEKLDSLSSYISNKKEMNKPLSIAEGLKFAKQAFYENDSTQYLMPNAFDGAFVGDYLKSNKSDFIFGVFRKRNVF